MAKRRGKGTHPKQKKSAGRSGFAALGMSPKATSTGKQRKRIQKKTRRKFPFS